MRSSEAEVPLHGHRGAGGVLGAERAVGVRRASLNGHGVSLFGRSAYSEDVRKLDVQF